MSQLELLKEYENKESPEIINLINLAKEKDEVALEKLYDKYKELLEGKFIRGMFKKFRVPDSDTEDAISIAKILFLSSIYSYDPKKSKFITYITMYIGWKFAEQYSKERLIKINTFKKSKDIVEDLKNTEIAHIGDAAGWNYNDKLKFEVETISLDCGAEKISVPRSVFIDKYILRNIDDILLNKEDILIYKKYIEYYLSTGKNPVIKIASEVGKKYNNVLKIINKSNKKVVEFLKMNNIVIGAN